MSFTLVINLIITRYKIDVRNNHEDCYKGVGTGNG